MSSLIFDRVSLMFVDFRSSEVFPGAISNGSGTNNTLGEAPRGEEAEEEDEEEVRVVLSPFSASGGPFKGPRSIKN